MYPYTKTEPKPCTVSARTKEATLSEDIRLKELLSLAEASAEQMAVRYKALLKEPALAEANRILKTMYLDQLRHKRSLREMFYLFWQDPPAPAEETLPAESPKGKALLEETLLAELDDAAFYRELYTAVPKREFRDVFFMLLADKQSHACGLTLLYAKYFS